MYFYFIFLVKYLFQPKILKSKVCRVCKLVGIIYKGLKSSAAKGTTGLHKNISQNNHEVHSHNWESQDFAIKEIRNLIM